MARARNLKPAFFANDQLGEIAPLGRLLFAGLWCLADREGRLEDRPKRIKAELLPYDECDVDQLLSDLESRDFIVRYPAGDGRYIQIIAFAKHQDPHYKEKASEIPAPTGFSESGTMPGGVAENVRQQVFDRDGRKCKECGSTDDLSLDHIVPRTKGGSHDPSNLQTLCRQCNSAKNNRAARADVVQPSSDDRPIIGQASANDSRDSPPLIPDSGFLTPDSGLRIPDPPNPAPRDGADPAKNAGRVAARKPRGGKSESPTAATAAFRAYATAYFARYHVEPVRNAKVMGQFAQLVERLGKDDAPHVAAHYLRSNNAFYVAKGHSTNCLLHDAEALRTAWATGRSVTQSEAHQIDRTQAVGNTFERLIDQAKDGTNG